jgi:hypothetical protein
MTDDESDPTANRSDSDLAMLVAAPVLGGFVAWLDDVVRDRGISHLYFASREGYFLQRYWEAWSRSQGTEVTSTYLLTSRVSLTACLIDEPEAVDVILRHPYEGQLGNFVSQRLGVPDSDYLAEMSAALPPELDLMRDRRAMTEFLLHPSPRIREICERNRRLMRRALHDVAFYGTEHAAFVDIGYSGTIPHLLSRVVGDDSFSKLYLVGTPAFHELPHSESFFGCTEWDNGDPVIDASLLLEGLLQAPHGSLYGYSSDGQPIFVPHVAKDAAEWARLSRIHDAAIAWIDSQRALFADPEVNREAGRLGLAAFIQATIASGEAGLGILEIDDAATGDTQGKPWLVQAEEWFQRVGGWNDWRGSARGSAASALQGLTSHGGRSAEAS